MVKVWFEGKKVESGKSYNSHKYIYKPIFFFDFGFVFRYVMFLWFYFCSPLFFSHAILFVKNNLRNKLFILLILIL